MSKQCSDRSAFFLSNKVISFTSVSSVTIFLIELQQQFPSFPQRDHCSWRQQGHHLMTYCLAINQSMIMPDRRLRSYKMHLPCNCCDNHQHVQHVRHLRRTDVTFDDMGNIMNGNRN